MSKYVSDVRALSNDPRYMGKPFNGSLAAALKQARKAPDHGVPDQDGRPAHISRSRWNLLEHLNLTRGLVERKPPKRAPAPKQPSPFSLEYAMRRWPQNFVVAP